MSSESVLGSSGASDRGLAAELSRVHATLAAAPDDAALLAGVMSLVERFGPTTVELYYLHSTARGRIDTAELLACWRHGAIQKESNAHRKPVAISELAFAPWWLKDPDALLTIEDVQRDPRCDSDLRDAAVQRGQQATAILPLYSQISRAVLFLNWSEPHILSDEERNIYGLLMRTLTSFIATRRAQLALSESLDETLQLYEVMAQINGAKSLQGALEAAGMLALDSGADLGALLMFDQAAGIRAETVSVAALVSHGTSSNQLSIGQQIPLRELVVSSLWQKVFDEPLLIEDVQNDPRLDAKSITRLPIAGRGALAVLPLLIGERALGLLLFRWPSVQRFGLTAQRLYQAIAKNAAIIIDNCMLIERMAKTLREKQEQGELMHAVLEHLPVGVEVVEVPSGRLTLFNHKVSEVLGRYIDSDGATDAPSFEAQLVRPGSSTPIPQEEQPLAKTLLTGQMDSQEIESLSGDGTRRTLDCTAAPIRDAGGNMHHAVVLFVDVTGRKQAEQERTRIQEDLIRYQAAALAERSTPLIPINEQIVVVPIIGTLDTERGEQLMDTLLSGVSSARARVAIIDITGSRLMDTQAARTLTSAVQSLRLLGVEAIITGVRAEVAQTLVRLNVSLDGIITRSNLQSGIAHALKVIGRSTLGK